MIQREIPLLSEARPLINVPDFVVDGCSDAVQAIAVSMAYGKISSAAVSGLLNIDAGQWSRIYNGKAHMPAAKRVPFMQLCGNRLLAQYDAKATGCELVELAKDRVIADLERQLAEARAA